MEEIKELKPIEAEKAVEPNEVEQNPALDEQFETKEIPFEDYEPANKPATKKDPCKNTLGLVSLVFGVFAIISNFITFPLSAYFPFVGIGFAIADKMRNKKLTYFGFSGLICSIVGYAITVLSTLLAIALFVFIYIFYVIIILANIGAAAM